MFQLLRQLEKAIAFVGRAPGIFQLELCGERTEINLSHGDHQAARSDFRLGACERCGRGNFAIVCQPGEVEGFVRIALAGVFMHRIVGDEAHATVLVALRVKIFVVEINLGQKHVASERAIDTGRAGFR